MICYCSYPTPPELDDLLLLSDGEHLTGVYFRREPPEGAVWSEAPFVPALRWLDAYFEGRDPGVLPSYALPADTTPFRRAVMGMLCTIPYGETVTYGDMARRLAREQGREKMSAQAVGGAVGRNPLCILIPCHRVVGSSGSLTGYGGGIRNKAALLTREGVDMSRFTLPTKGTRL